MGRIIPNRQLGALFILNYRQPIPPLWLAIWIPLLASAWLMPNHYYPWTTFHSDALMAVMLSVAAPAVILSSPVKLDWHASSILAALLVPVPFLQFAAGMIHFGGQAWISTAYILGALMALLIGAHWEKLTPGRAVDGLMLAIGIAALASVGMQLRQWLSINEMTDAMQIWVGEYSPGRPSANLGQPNQLATLLLWGLAGCAWSVARKQARAGYAVAAAMVLIFGIVLTQSRMANLAMVVIALAALGWRRLWPSANVVRVVILLFAYFVVCTMALQYLNDLLGLSPLTRSASLGGETTRSRVEAYTLFLDAAMRHPWWGYGWNQLATAQLSVSDQHPPLWALFLQSHNLFLDFVLWCGWPLGLAMSAFMLWWVARCIWRASTTEDVILITFLLVVGLHAMVELPLHHAYFLLPAALVAGVLNRRLHYRIIASANRYGMLALWLGVTMLLGVVIRDYLRVEENFWAYRLESARIGRLPPGRPPDVLILDDFHAFIQNARTDVYAGMDADALEQLKWTTISFSTPSNMFNYAKALALNGRPEEARQWIKKTQNSEPEGYSRDMKQIWDFQSQSEPRMAEVGWPAVQKETEGTAGSPKR